MSIMAAVHALTAAEILSAWEEGVALDAIARPAVLLRHAGVAAEPDAVEGWSIGRRDAALIDLHVKSFGPRVDGTAPCASCGNPLEIAFEVDDIRSPVGDAGTAFELSGEVFERVVFRLPTSSDLRHLTACESPERAAHLLAERCVLERDSGVGRPLPESLVEALGEAVAEHDPQSHVLLEATCPGCRAVVTVLFDIADFLWREVAFTARQLLAAVHVLASSYGWPESEILRMPAGRRRTYLEMIWD